MTRPNQLISALIKLGACGAGTCPAPSELFLAEASRARAQALLLKTGSDQFVMGCFHLDKPPQSSSELLFISLRLLFIKGDGAVVVFLN